MTEPIVAEVKIWRVLVPLLKEWCADEQFGGHHDGPPRTIIYLRDSDGNSGWGEGLSTATGKSEEELLRQLLGLRVSLARLASLPLPAPNYFQVPLSPSPFAQNEAAQRHRIRHPLQGATEMALLDLIARRAGVSLSTLAGGPWRDRVPVDYWMGRVSPEKAASCVQRAKSLGFSGVKIKTTLEDPNVERLEAIKSAAGGSFHVTVDANGRFYRLDDALPTLLAMDAVGNMNVLEDPFHRLHLHEFAALRPRLRARLAVHIDPPESLFHVLSSGAAGCLNIDSHTQGLLSWRYQAAAADAANLAIWHGSVVDLGIATAAQLHFAAATPNCQLPGDQAGPWLRHSSLLTTRFVVESGHVLVPPGAGLGVEIDRDALDRYTLQHWHT